MFRNKSYSIRTGLVIKASTVQITLGGIHVFPTDFSDVGYTEQCYVKAIVIPVDLVVEVFQAICSIVFLSCVLYFF